MELTIAPTMTGGTHRNASNGIAPSFEELHPDIIAAIWSNTYIGFHMPYDEVVAIDRYLVRRLK